MQRVFVVFPVGLSGIGLLLLRLAAAFTVVCEAHLFLTMLDEPHYALALLRVIGLIAISLLLAGFCTRIGCALLVLQIAGVFAFSSAACLRGTTVKLLVMNIVVMLLVIATVGPGIFSLDARLFGRRKIVFPN